VNKKEYINYINLGLRRLKDKGFDIDQLTSVSTEMMASYDIHNIPEIAPVCKISIK